MSQWLPRLYRVHMEMKSTDFMHSLWANTIIVYIPDLKHTRICELLTKQYNLLCYVMGQRAESISTCANICLGSPDSNTPRALVVKHKRYAIEYKSNNSNGIPSVILCSIYQWHNICFNPIWYEILKILQIYNHI